MCSYSRYLSPPNNSVLELPLLSISIAVCEEGLAIDYALFGSRFLGRTLYVTWINYRKTSVVVNILAPNVPVIGPGLVSTSPDRRRRRRRTMVLLLDHSFFRRLACK